MKNIELVPAAMTGQTPMYSNQMQDWARQDFLIRDIECYCLDAPLFIPNGGTKLCFRDPNGTIWGQSTINLRPGTGV